MPKLALFLSFMFLFVCASCRKEIDVDKTLDLEWKVSPSEVAIGPITLDLFLSQKSKLEKSSGLKIEVEGNMTHPGMVPVKTQALEISPGHYQANMTLTMGGDWIFFVTIHANDGSIREKQFELKGVKSVAP